MQTKHHFFDLSVECSWAVRNSIITKEQIFPGRVGVDWDKNIG